MQDVFESIAGIYMALYMPSDATPTFNGVLKVTIGHGTLEMIY